MEVHNELWMPTNSLSMVKSVPYYETMVSSCLCLFVNNASLSGVFGHRFYLRSDRDKEKCLINFTSVKYYCPFFLYAIGSIPRVNDFQYTPTARQKLALCKPVLSKQRQNKTNPLH